MRAIHELKRKKKRKMESKKAKQRLNKTQISMKNRELNFGPLKRGVLVPYGKYSFFISLESSIGFLEIYKVDTTYP